MHRIEIVWVFAALLLAACVVEPQSARIDIDQNPARGWLDDTAPTSPPRYGPPRPTPLQEIDALNVDEVTKEKLRLRWQISQLTVRLDRIKTVKAGPSLDEPPWYALALENEEARTRQEMDRLQARLKAIE